MKKLFAVILALTMVFGLIAEIPIAACATSTSIAKKTATPVDDDGRFEVKIQVPGADGTQYHDEVIVMVDGSYSTDRLWPTTKASIIEIGKTVLEGNGNTLLTLMTFGMGDNIVLKHVKSVSELEASLTNLPGGLLYGRSSTNCEAGFTGVAEYIDNHDSTLNEVNVIYITDARINTDETPYAFYNWTQNTWIKNGVANRAKNALAEELDMIAAGYAKPSHAYIEVFGDPEDEPEEAMVAPVPQEEQAPAPQEEEAPAPQEEEAPAPQEEEAPAPQEEEAPAPQEEEAKSRATSDDEITDEEAMRWAQIVWDDVYAYSGLDPETEYPVSDAERAFVKYDKENGTYIQDAFYWALVGRTYPNQYTRTPAAGIALASKEKVAHLYLVDSDTATSWMSDIASSVDNASFYEAGSMNNLMTTLKGVLTNLAYTPYNDVVVTDYMSKWVNLDQTTIKVVDNYANETIWTNKDGWLISENRPTSREIPVVVEEVAAKDYADGGINVEGNQSGTIYKLTWYVKDGAMLRHHNYSLVYEVDVDTDETGFRYNTEYPANGTTTIEYTEKNGDEEEPKSEDIPVPDVYVEGVETITINGEKKWEDDDNKAGKRPSSITVNLLADGEKVAFKIVTENDNWQYSFNEIAKYNANGEEIVYTIEEEKVADYETKITGYNITNTYIEPEPEVKPETVEVSGTKTWNDNGNQYGKRPNSITVNLLADGEKVAFKIVTENDNWQYSFKELEKYNADGKEIVYTIEEEKVTGYETKITGYNITNTYIEPEPEVKPETVEVSGTKTWNDNGNQYGKRPSSITVNLLANGKKIASKQVTAKDGWKYSFGNLPKFDDNGKQIVYTVTENKVASYTTKINGYDIVNTYKRSFFNYSDNPKTGDYIYNAVITAVVSGGLLIFMCCYMRKKNKSKK